MSDQEEEHDGEEYDEEEEEEYINIMVMIVEVSSTPRTWTRISWGLTTQCTEWKWERLRMTVKNSM